MDDYQEMESFGTEKDFEDGQWIGSEFCGEFYYRKRKEKRTQTKEDVLAAGSDSDEDEDGLSSKKRRKDRDLFKKQDFSKLVNFVYTATVMPNQEIDDNSKEENKNGVDEDDRPVLGGLGFNSLKGKDGKGDGADEADDDANFLPTAFCRKLKEGVQRKEREREISKMERKSQGKGGNRKDSDLSDVGGFEENTKGIGMKLLEKMGYKGGGLGKNKQGIVNPIEVKLRPKNMGMGFNDYKETPKSAPVPELEEKKTTLSLPIVKAKERLWSKNARDKKKKDDYITAEQLLADKQAQDLDVVKVFDMRGPQVRVLTNLENLNAEKKARESNGPMSKLQHNMQLMVDSAELDIRQIYRNLRNEKETAMRLQKDKEKFKNEAARQKQRLDNMQEIMRVLDGVGEDNSKELLALDELAKCLGDLKTKFYGINTWQDRDLESMLRFLNSWKKLLPPSVLCSIFDNIIMPKMTTAETGRPFRCNNIL